MREVHREAAMDVALKTPVAEGLGNIRVESWEKSPDLGAFVEEERS
jgi:hypothetical protein